MKNPIARSDKATSGHRGTHISIGIDSRERMDSNMSDGRDDLRGFPDIAINPGDRSLWGARRYVQSRRCHNESDVDQATAMLSLPGNKTDAFSFQLRHG